jgi:hypothetical protein
MAAVQNYRAGDIRNSSIVAEAVRILRLLITPNQQIPINQLSAGENHSSIRG